MLHALMMYLRLRRLNGRTMSVARPGRDGLIGLRRVKVSPFGIGGIGLDGDDIFMPWSSVSHVEWGVGTDRIVASKLAVGAGNHRAEGDGRGDDSPIGAMLHSMIAARLASESDEDDTETPTLPKPALSEAEIAAALEEDKKGLV